MLFQNPFFLKQKTKGELCELKSTKRCRHSMKSMQMQINYAVYSKSSEAMIALCEGQTEI